MTRFGKTTSALSCFVLCLLILPAGEAEGASWTFTPELRRLDAQGNELPAGSVDVARHEVLRVGLYVAVVADGDGPAHSGHLGFESLSGAIHFFGETLEASDIGPVVRSLRGGRGWERRMANASFDPDADGWLGPPEEADNETSWIAFWSDPTNVRANPRGAWCADEAGSCSIFVGVLTISVAQLPADAVGDLSLRFGGVASAEARANVGAIFGRAEETVVAGNTITYNICPASGCAVADDSAEPDRESRALAMKFALAGFGREVGGNVGGHDRRARGNERCRSRHHVSGAGRPARECAGARLRPGHGRWQCRLAEQRHGLAGRQPQQPGRAGLGGGPRHRDLLGLSELRPAAERPRFA